jgi:D-galactarolactone cycloisomerase
MPNTEVVEFIGGSAYVDGLLADPFRLDTEGYLEIPMSPGIGVSLDPEKVAKYSPNWRRLFEC